MNWRVVRAIAQKDIVDAFKNRYILFSLVLPILLSVILKLAMPSPDQPVTWSIAVYDAGQSSLVTNLRALPDVKIVEATSQDDLVNKVTDDVIGGLMIPADFDTAVQAGNQPNLIVYQNETKTSSTLFTFQRMVEQQVWGLLGQKFPAQIAWKSVLGSGPAAQEPFNFESYILNMLIVTTLAMAGVFVVPLLMVEEREKHTLDALLVSPARPVEIAVGKAITGLVYSFLIAGLLMLLNKGWTGNWPITVLAVLLGSVFVVAVGLFFGSVLRTTRQVNTWSGILILALMLPSWLGLFSSSMSWMVVFKLIPTYYVSNLIRLAMVGTNVFSQLAPDFAILILCIVAAFALVVWDLRRDTTRP